MHASLHQLKILILSGDEIVLSHIIEFQVQIYFFSPSFLIPLITLILLVIIGIALIFAFIYAKSYYIRHQEKIE